MRLLKKFCTKRPTRLVKLYEQLRVEPLESRKMLTLLNVVPDFPVTTYDSNGIIAYDATNDTLDMSATPLRFKESVLAPQRLIQNPKDFEIHIQVDSSGNLIGGTPGNDFYLEGSIDIDGNGSIDVSGVLLTGEISQFGFEETGATDLYDFRFTPTGGALMTPTHPYFIGKDIGVTLTSEGSTFTGSFGGNFTGGAKGNIGTLEPLLSSLAGNVYEDNNNNGIFETGLGEAGINGATVTLTGTNVDGQVINTATFTNASGAYSFPNLRPGTYTITETQPGGYLDGKDTQGTPGNGTPSNDQFSTISLAAGVNGIENNFGELVPASIAGFVYVDADNDGVFDMGEAPIGGATVALTGTDDLGNAVNIPGSTNGAGAYSFSNLRPGTYTITEAQPGGYLDGKDTQGTPGNGIAGNDVFATITLSAGVNGTDNNFGELLPASLAGFVYVDADNDGVFDMGEAPISGAAVTLTGTDDLGNAVNIPAITNGAGAYSFTNLRPGDYTVTETQPGGYLDGKDTQGTPGNGTTNNDQFAGITLASGVNGTDNNFGELVAASLAGFVYVDADNDGVFDMGEAPIPGTSVTLTGSNDLGAIAPIVVMTNGSGAYAFNNLRPGTYTVTETQPAGFLDGKDTQGTPGNGTTNNDQFAGVTLASGVNGQNNNFGELVAASLAGFVYVDADNDGVFDMGESPIPGTTVTLTGSNDLGPIAPIVVMTNGSGAYAFNNLRPGTYSVTETQPAAFADGKDTQGTPGNGTAINDAFLNIVLASGVAGQNNNFGERPLGSIGGTKYEDLTGNGKSYDDVGLGGTTIYIDANNNGVKDSGERSTVTGASGQYSFTGLAAGTYIIREIVPTGWIRTAPALSDNYVVTISTGQSATGKDFANFEKCDMDDLTNIYYVINGTTVVTDLRGNVRQGDVVEVFFTVVAGAHAHDYSLVSYTAPSSTFVASEASEQEIFDQDTGLFGPGEHSLTVTVPHCYFQIDFVCGLVIDQLGPAGSNIFYTPQNRLFSADNGGTNACLYEGSLSGFVFVDLNNDGDVDATDLAIPGVKVTLTGTDKYGNAVSQVAYTDDDGMYLFDNLKAGTYKITETDPEGYNDGLDILGSLGGTKYNDMFANIALNTGRTGVNYNFAECRITETINNGMTATIAFWNNSRGQTLIKALNGSSYSTKLGNWLATTFPNMYGSSAGTANMTGKTNAQVASYFQSLFSSTSKKLEAQVLATALAVYSTNSTLAGGTYARSYGFVVNTTGTGAAKIDIGENGVALGVADHAVLTISQILQKTNDRAHMGRLWDLNDSNSTSSAESFLRNLGLDLFTQINAEGGIVS